MKNIAFSNLSFSCVTNKYLVSAKGIGRDVGINPTEKSHQFQPMIITSVVDTQPF